MIQASIAHTHGSDFSILIIPHTRGYLEAFLYNGKTGFYDVRFQPSCVEPPPSNTRTQISEETLNLLLELLEAKKKITRALRKDIRTYPPRKVTEPRVKRFHGW